MAVPIDFSLHLGDVLVTAALGGIGMGLRAIYNLINGKIQEHDQLVDDVDEHASVLNMHTTVFNADGHAFPIIERRRNQRRHMVSE